MPKRTHRNPDHVQRHNQPSPNNEAIANQFKALLTPAITSQSLRFSPGFYIRASVAATYYRQLGLRARILNLPLMVAVVLTRFVATSSGRTGVNAPVGTRRLTPCRATKVSQQALSEQFLTFPAELFERVFKDLLPQLQAHWQQRSSRPLPDSIKFARKHFERIWVADGSTKDSFVS